MTIATLTILAVTGSLVLLKLGIMAMVVVLWARVLSSDGPVVSATYATGTSGSQ